MSQDPDNTVPLLGGEQSPEKERPSLYVIAGTSAIAAGVASVWILGAIRALLSGSSLS